MNIFAFLNWNVKLYRAFGIEVRVHWLLIAYVVLQILAAFQKYGVSALTWSPAMIFLVFLIVLLHEYGHCFAARYVGGSANTIILWPLGGLAMVSSPHTPRAEFISTAGGPLVNVALMVLGYGARQLLIPHGEGSLFLFYLVTVFYDINISILLFNLIPCYPLDGGRLFNAILWPIVGFERATTYTMWLAIFISAGLFVYSLVTMNLVLMVIAALVFWQVWRILKMRSVDAASMFIYGSPAYTRTEKSVPIIQKLREIKQEKRAQQHREEKKKTLENIDQILDKINRVGIEGLTMEERQMLDKSSKLLREEE